MASIEIPAKAAAPRPAAAPRSFARRVLSTWKGGIGGAIVLVALAMAVFAHWIAPFPPTEIDFDRIMQPPVQGYPFGTDEVGRDILSRVIYGARTSLSVAVFSVAFSVAVGGLIGLLAGWIGGIPEKVVMRVMDAILAFPLIVLALTIVAVLGPGLQNAILAIGIVTIPHFARLMRGEVLVLKDLEYIKAITVLGGSNARILFRHVLPNAMGPVLVYSSIAASQAIITEASLSFLGLGVQPPTPSWGGMVAIGMQNFQLWWMGFFPGLAIFAIVLAFNLLGDAVRDALDARLE